MHIVLLILLTWISPRETHVSVPSLQHSPPWKTLKRIHKENAKMQITEEQRQRSEANRLAALEKRKAYIINQQQQQQPPPPQNPWRLFKCRKLSPKPSSSKTTTNPPLFNRVNPDLDTHLPQTFRVRLEICSPDSFSITPEAMKGFPYPGEEKCLNTLKSRLSNVNGFSFFIFL